MPPVGLDAPDAAPVSGVGVAFVAFDGVVGVVIGMVEGVVVVGVVPVVVGVVLVVPVPVVAVSVGVVSVVVGIVPVAFTNIVPDIIVPCT